MHTTMTESGARRGRRGRAVRVGPEDSGRRMTLADFAGARGEPGYAYELAHGVIQVTEIPGMSHFVVVERIHESFVFYKAAHPGVIAHLAPSFASKVEMWGCDTERHPDLAIYLSPSPPGVEQPWDIWIPEIVIEVVSASSAKRDFEEKPADYLDAGVREYWIIDPVRRGGLFHVRRADTWIERRLGARGKWHTPLLPGYTLDLARVLGQAKSKR